MTLRSRCYVGGMKWIVTKKTDPDTSMEIYFVRATKAASWDGHDVWVNRRGNGLLSDARCTGCSSPLCGMSASCAHAKSRMTDFCDVNCDSCGRWEATDATTLAAARLYLKRKLWTVRWQDGEKQDVCPHCNGYSTLYWGCKG